MGTKKILYLCLWCLINCVKPILNHRTMGNYSFRDGAPTTDPVEALPSGGGCGMPLGSQQAFKW